LSQGFFLTLALHLHQVLGVLRAGVVDATLGLLLALPATRTLILVVSDGLGRVPVTNALVATVKELVVWDIVFLDVGLDLFKGPVGQGVDLDKASLVNLDDVEVTALATLATATASEDGVDIHLTVSTLGRLDLGNPIVELIIDLPQARAVLGLELSSSVSTERLVYVDVVERVTLADLVHKSQGLREVVKSIQEDEVDHLGPRNIQLGQHIKGDKASQAKGSSLEQVRQ